ncbi:NAD(P)/FAD-dependent oxidoreductase [Brucellaceae bacterium D45D]
MTARFLPGTGDPAWDVVIVGSGPAGSATAITLARLGQRVLMVEKRAALDFKLGETLLPGSIGLVKHLLGEIGGRVGAFAGVFQTAGTVSLWANGQPDGFDFFFTSSGHGLCVDRLAFDEALRQSAIAAVVTLIKGTGFQSCKRVGDGSCNWEVVFVSDKQNRQVHARYIVDCTGRQAAVAQTLGVSFSPDEDRLFAYAQWFISGGQDDDRHTRIEAAAQVWWYSSRLPGSDHGQSRRLVVFFSDKDLPASKLAVTPQGFDQLLRETKHMAPLLWERGYEASGAIGGAPAHSQRLERFCGDGWLAVGDAAQAYDPLSSQGIDKALNTGSHAGHMIHYALADEPGLFDASNSFIRRYDEEQRRLWADYISQRDYSYTIQPRWAGETFWERRRQHIGTAQALPNNQ